MMSTAIPYDNRALRSPINSHVFAAPKHVGKYGGQAGEDEIRCDESQENAHPRFCQRHHRGIAHDQAEFRKVEPSVEEELGRESNLPAL